MSVFIGCPSYDGRIDGAMALQVCLRSTRVKDRVARIELGGGSLLCHGCNELWGSALDVAKDHGLTWFAMVHSDVVPDDWWLDTLIAEAEAHDADMMSAIIPIKDDQGIASTAIADEKHLGAWCRLTMKQLLHPSFPDTFDFQMARNALAEDLPEHLRVPNIPNSFLMVNTGCCLFRLNRDWNDKAWFEMRDGIRKGPDGRRPVVEPEDWRFSRMATIAGAKVMATRKVKVMHKGGAIYHSDQTWGNDRDEDSLSHYKVLPEMQCQS